MCIRDRLEMVRGHSKYFREALLKVSSRSNIRKLVKNQSILQVFSWKLEGQGCSWFKWRWCQGTQNTPGKLYRKYHQDPTSWSLSRLHLSSKSLPGVLKDRDDLDFAWEGARVLKIFQGSFPESIIKIQHQEACQDSIYPPSLFLESWRTGMFLI